MKVPNTLSAHDRRRVAVAASVSPRTVDRYLVGADVRSTCAARIAEALRSLGLDRLVRQEHRAGVSQ